MDDRAYYDGRASVDEKEEFMDSDGTGISVSHEDGLDFGIVERKRTNGPFATPSRLLIIERAYDYPAVTFVKEKTGTSDGSDPECVIAFRQLRLFNRHGCTRFEAVFEGDSPDIRSGTTSPVRVIFSPKFEGLFQATLELVFYHSQKRAWFVIRRTLQGTAGSIKDHKHLESLGQEGDDKPTEGNQGVPPRKIVLFPGDPGRKSRYFPDYKVSPMVQQAINNSSAAHPYDKYAADLVSALRPDSLNMNTYAHYFASLLSVEDGHQQHVRSRRWAVLCRPANEVNVQERGQQYRRVTPDLGPKCTFPFTKYLHSVEIENDDEDLLPEVVLGDFLWLDDVKNNIRYEARVAKIDVFTRHHLAILDMLVRLPPDSNLYQGTHLALQLKHNRLIIRHQYHALTSSFTSPRRLLFPSVSDIKLKRHLSRAEIYNLKFRHLVNRTIRDDPQQLQAVVSILEQPPGSVPFLVYGP
jgi:helicase MOV-10